jgi:hypothetical protein
VGRIKYKELAGIEVKRGRPTKANKPSESQLKKLYTKESRSIREIADILGCSKDMVYRALKKHKIERRSHVKRLKLEKYDFDFIKETVKKKGYRRGAQELGVNKSTLYRYLKKRGK